MFIKIKVELVPKKEIYKKTFVRQVDKLEWNITK